MKAFCEECRDYINYEIKEIDRSKEIRGRKIDFKEKIAYCEECNGELFVSELRDENLASIDNAYRKAEGLVTIGEIVTILEKYNIGKRPLSLLLGWGETTLTRFVNGDIPSKIYSDMLKKISESPSFFLEILIKNKHNITETAYKKSFNITNYIISNIKECQIEGKIESVCNYIISKNEITPLALQKLLYFVQAFYKVFTGDFMFNEDCEAWVHGPVYKDIYIKYKDHGYNPIEDKQEQFECFELSQDEREIIDVVVHYFGCYSGKVLEKMTHFEEPWKETRKGLDEREVSNEIISKQSIEKYFNQVHDKFDMLNIMDIQDYSEDLFKKIRY